MPGNKCRRNAIHHATLATDLAHYFNGEKLPARTTADASGMQPEWEETMHRLINSSEQMRQRVVEWARQASPETFASYVITPETCQLDNCGRMIFKGGEPVMVAGEPRIDTAAAYRAIFAAEQGQLRARLDQLEAEHRDRVGSYYKLPTDRARATADRIIKELEQEMADIEAKLTDAATDNQQARAHLDYLLTSWEEARQAVNSDASDRRRADAIRRVVARINVSFTSTGKAYRGTKVSGVEIVPQAGGNYPTPTALRPSGGCSRRGRPAGSSRCCTSTASC